MTRDLRVLCAFSALEGIVLGYGLETCFGIGQYRKIMLLGAAGGLGIGGLSWLVRAAVDRAPRARAASRPVVLAAVLPAVALFAVWFLWRVLPLIKEELAFSL